MIKLILLNNDSLNDIIYAKNWIHLIFEKNYFICIFYLQYQTMRKLIKKSIF